MDTTTLDLSSLTDDGDTLELPDGRTLRLRIIPDDIDPTDLMDEECYGKLAWCVADRYLGRHAPRPEGFTGRAYKVSTRDGVWWWEPPADVVDVDQARRLVRDLLEYGYCGYVLEVLDGTDAYGRPIVADVASIWGVEPFADREYVAEIVADLASELDL